MHIQRLQRELALLTTNTHNVCSAHTVDDNILHWKATLKGPDNSPYEDGTFELDIVFSDNYPFSPPKIRFITEIFHPNIYKFDICLDILNSNWSPVYTVDKTLISLRSLLTDPNAGDPLNDKAGQLYSENRNTFNKIARMTTQKFAIKDTK